MTGRAEIRFLQLCYIKAAFILGEGRIFLLYLAAAAFAAFGMVTVSG